MPGGFRRRSARASLPVLPRLFRPPLRRCSRQVRIQACRRLCSMRMDAGPMHEDCSGQRDHAPVDGAKPACQAGSAACPMGGAGSAASGTSPEALRMELQARWSRIRIRVPTGGAQRLWPEAIGRAVLPRPLPRASASWPGHRAKVPAFRMRRCRRSGRPRGAGCACSRRDPLSAGQPGGGASRNAASSRTIWPCPRRLRLAGLRPPRSGQAVRRSLRRQASVCLPGVRNGVVRRPAGPCSRTGADCAGRGPQTENRPGCGRHPGRVDVCPLRPAGWRITRAGSAPRGP